MFFPRPPSWLVDRTVWLRHRLSRWLFYRLGRHAPIVMLGLLLGLPWICNLAWMYMCLTWAFEGLWVSVPRFVVMLAAIAIPTEALFFWFRRMSGWLDLDEGRRLGALARSFVAEKLATSPACVHPWNPAIQLEAWMVSWAFDEAQVRRAAVAGLEVNTPAAKSSPPIRRL